MAEGKKTKVEKNWVDRLYVLNKVDLGKKIPHWLLAPIFNAVLYIFGKIGRLPVLRKIHPWVRSDINDMRWLPINEDISKPEDMPMPLSVLDRCIETASHRVVFDYCFCRKAGNCQNYPVDIGCLMMGDEALEIMGSSGYEVGVEEAKAHARKAIATGLVPIIGKARADGYLFGFRDHDCLLSVCFCCECCCIGRAAGAWSSEVLEEFFPRLDGISIRVTDACDGCGKCVEKCFVHAIEIKNQKAIIAEDCRVCGRCASVCLNNAIEITMDDPDFVEKTYQRMLGYTDFL